MRLCVGTAKGIVILDPARGVPSMIHADPPSVWCVGQDTADPGLLYAGAVHNHHAGSARGKAALARSTDGGRTWSDITPGSIRDEEVWTIATTPEPGEVFIGTSHARVLHSRDGGRNFRECSAFLKLPGRDRWTFPPPPHIPHVRSIAYDPRNPAMLYVGVEEGGVFRSRDHGESFEPLNHSIYADIHNVAVDRVDSDRLYATTGRGFYLSVNGGASWRQIRGLSRSYTVPLTMTAAGPVYTAAAAGPPPTWTMSGIGADAQLFRSDDQGESFRPLAIEGAPTPSTRGIVMRLVAAPDAPEMLYGVMTDGTIIRLDTQSDAIETIAEKLPPAYDLAIVP